MQREIRILRRYGLPARIARRLFITPQPVEGADRTSPLAVAEIGRLENSRYITTADLPHAWLRDLGDDAMLAVTDDITRRADSGEIDRDEAIRRLVQIGNTETEAADHLDGE